MNHRHREFPATASKHDRAIPRVERSVDLDLVEAFGMADICEPEIVLLGPEERNGIEVRRALALELKSSAMRSNRGVIGLA